MSTLEGTTLGHYYLTRLLGRGGMAEVYLAFDEHVRREVALKVIHYSHRDELARFRREAEMLGSLIHEHILPVFAYGEQHPWHYLVMPYMSAGTLQERIQARGPLSQEEAGLLLEQIASALQYAHERGILHRDIKPSNVLLRDDTYAYVADFGIAKALNQESELTKTGVIIGTPEYMAPELLEQPASPDSDIYALGVLLYYMLTGQVPFTGPTSLAILIQHMTTQPIRPSHLNPAISLPIEDIVLSALEKDQEHRFHTPQALAHSYRQALQASPRAASVHPHPSLGLDFFTRVRHPAVFITVIALMLVVLLLTAPFWSGTRGSSTSQHGVSQTPIIHVPTASSHVSTPSPTTSHVSTPSPTTSHVSTPSPTTSSTSCSSNDAAHIINKVQVCEVAHTLSHPLAVYTTNTFQKGDGDFDSLSQSLVTSPQMIVIAINVKPSPEPKPPKVHVNIVGGIAVPLADSQYHQAMDVFNHAAVTGDYTEATMEAIQTLHTAVA